MKIKKTIAVFTVLLLFTAVAGQSIEWGLAAEGLDLSDRAEVQEPVAQRLTLTDGASEDADDTIRASGSVADVIRNSYSAKNFAQRTVSREDLELILQSGLKAPSARNSQPWHFTAVTNPELALELVRDAVDGTVVIVISGVSDPGEGIDVSFDCALAAENMFLTARSLGLGGHLYTGGVSNINQQYREQLGIPQGYQAVSILLVGYVENEADAVSSASARAAITEKVNYIE